MDDLCFTVWLSDGKACVINGYSADIDEAGRLTITGRKTGNVFIAAHGAWRYLQSEPASTLSDD